MRQYTKHNYLDNEFPALGGSSTTGQIAKLPESFASSLNISNNSSQKPTESWPDSIPMYPNQYIAIGQERLASSPKSTKPSSSKLQDTGSSSSSEGGMTWGKESYEVMDYDKRFQKFVDRISQNPKQALRYSRGLVPLFYSSKDTLGRVLLNEKGALIPNVIPPCALCREPRVVELQVMPQAAASLVEETLESLKSEKGIDWGIITVATCGKDCGLKKGGEVSFIEEWVSVMEGL